MKLIPTVLLTRSKPGFSLIEVQVVVAIIALVAAIVLPQVPRFLTQAADTKGRANAKNLAAVANAASAAGIEFASLDSAIAEMVRAGGVTTEIGLRCGLPSLSATEVNEAKQHLGFWNGQVVYQSN